ncbi:hypothetical protein [Fibrella aestuarina]|uniref:hypothetical protein n=1 Tax=Fibrella aestuarina TaxID=651143 RepID=UPI0011D297C7|nr:hypothetical protein [Fibrella aestuarina]
MQSLAGNRTSDYWKDVRALSGFGINHNVEKAFRAALEGAPEQLAADYIGSQPEAISKKERVEIGRYFTSLAYQLSRADLPDNLIDRYVHDRAAFVEQLLNERSEQAYTPDLSTDRSQHLLAWLVIHLEKKLGLYFLEELKRDHNTEVGYSIALLEQCALDSRRTREQLDQLADALGDIASHQQTGLDLLRQVLHSLQLMQEYHRKQGIDFRAYRRDFEALLGQLNERQEPVLTLPVYDLSKQPRNQLLDYHLQHTTFLGREPEMEALLQFMNSQPDKPFQWWMVTGPGGMGKSRLAFEFCQTMSGLSYHIGFLEKSDLEGGFAQAVGWSRWRPTRPTLIVIDYVAAYASSVQDMLGILQRCARQLPHRVRVLLLERETREDWWAGFENDPAIHQSRYGGIDHPLLDLPPFDDERIWNIITEVYQKEGKGPLHADKDETLAKLADLDPERRPLFAFLVGLALAADGDIRHWNVEQLLTNLLKRYEDKFWKKHPSYQHNGQAHKNLLMLATLARGIPAEKIDDLYATAIAGLPEQIDSDLYERMATVVRDAVNSPVEYAGLQPDLVGEYFVLKQLTELLRQPNGRQKAESLLQAAWSVKASDVWWMCWMAVEDFYPYFATTAIPSLTLTDLPQSASAEDALYWSQWQYNLAHTDSQVPDKERHYQKVKTLNESEAFVHDAPIALQRAMAAYNLTKYYGDDKNLPAAERKYEDLKALNESEAFAHDPPIALRRARAAVNLTKYYGDDKNLPAAERKYEDLKALNESEAFAHDPPIALHRAMAAYNLTKYYGDDKNLPAAERKYEDLKALNESEAFAHDPPIALQRAMAAYNLTLTYCRNEYWQQAGAKVDDARQLAELFSSDEAIGYEAAKAMGAFLAFTQEAPAIIENRAALVDRLAELIQRFGQSSVWEEYLPVLKDVLAAELT